MIAHDRARPVRIAVVAACCLMGPARDGSRVAPARELPAPAAESGEEVLPVSLPAALELANVQAWDIALAVQHLRIASAQLQGAQVLWLPESDSAASITCTTMARSSAQVPAPSSTAVTVRCTSAWPRWRSSV